MGLASCQSSKVNISGRFVGSQADMVYVEQATALEQIMAFDKDAKVVMVSALGKEELVKKSLMLGAKNYIVKPLDRKKVLERLAASIK